MQGRALAPAAATCLVASWIMTTTSPSPNKIAEMDTTSTMRPSVPRCHLYACRWTHSLNSQLRMLRQQGGRRARWELAAQLTAQRPCQAVFVSRGGVDGGWLVCASNHSPALAELEVAPVGDHHNEQRQQVAHAHLRGRAATEAAASAQAPPGCAAAGGRLPAAPCRSAAAACGGEAAVLQPPAAAHQD